MVTEDIKFIKTSTSNLEGAQEDYPNSFIHIHDEGDSDSDADDILYIGKDKITDKLNVGDRDVTTATQGIGGLEPDTIGGLRKKSVSDIIIDMVTPSDKPLDSRLVVDSKADLLTIDSPYKGMVVNVKGSPILWILVGDDPTSYDSWEKVSGTGSGDGNGLSKYSLPVMTPEMVEEAEGDSDIDFDGSEDPYILVEYDTHETNDTDPNIFYKGIIQDMYRSIIALQQEVTRLRNSFEFGIDSYTNTRTAKSDILGGMTDVEMIACSSLISTVAILSSFFDTIVLMIAVNASSLCSFEDCIGYFYDGNDPNADDTKLTLAHLNDSKLITYLVTDSPNIVMNLVSLDNSTTTKDVHLNQLLNDNSVERYGFCIVISRKDKTTQNGFNYIYISIIDYDNDHKLYEGYLTTLGTLSDTRVEVPERFTIHSIEFDRLTLSRMKFYTKFEDFSETVIPSKPSENDWKYEVAHLAIRSVENTDMLNSIEGQLKENELIWNKKSGTLHIKSNGKIYRIGSNSVPDDDNNNNDTMTDKELIQALDKMGIVVKGVVYEKDEDGNDIIKSCDTISLKPISDITFIHQDTGNKFNYSVDSEGNLVGKYAGNLNVEDNTIADLLEKHGNTDGYDQTNYQAVRGFIADYLSRKKGYYTLAKGVNSTGDAGKMSDRLRISSFYAPISTDTTHGCTHSFIELENTSDTDIPLEGIYLHFFNAAENTYSNENNVLTLTSDNVHHLALDGVIKAGSTYLIRGAKHAEFEDASAFIKVKTFDKEWYENGELVSFEQEPVKVENGNVTDDSPAKAANRFCLTYGLPELSAKTKLVEANTNGKITFDGEEKTYKVGTYPTRIVNARFIDSCSFSTVTSVAQKMGDINPWYANATTASAAGQGITIVPNSMFRLMFALDPAKQAYNGFNKSDSSRVRYNSANDLQVLRLDKEFIGFPHSKEIIRIDRFTPKASFENRNVMTDKTQLNKEKPNMVTCSFGVDVYNTRCFNWISCGTFDEYVWLRVKNDSEPNEWIPFQSYTKVSLPNENPEADTFTTVTVSEPTRKEYSPLVNNTVYARMINRFKCVVVLPDASTPTVYEYVVGRPDKDGNPDMEHTNEIYTFTVYPRTYEGRVYQVTDQQGFHWIEYQVWAASAEFLNKKIDEECSTINSVNGNVKVFPILINTGDMTQSGARINEWLDYYNGGVSLFNHLEQMNCVGNNDLCPINPRELGTGNDDDKSSSHFFHYFYCFDVKDTDVFSHLTDVNKKKFFSGETLIVKKHTGSALNEGVTYDINVTEDKYIPSFYYFKTGKVLYIMVNSEIPYSNIMLWYGLNSTNNRFVNIYTGIEVIQNGNYAIKSVNNPNGIDYFTPIYETLYTWLDTNDTDNDVNVKKVIVAMHEMPFTVITKASLSNKSVDTIPCTRNHPTGDARLGSNINQVNINENRGIYWCSRLLEYFNCKLVIGGHKHTYALSYPIREKYTWSLNGAEAVDSGRSIKVMLPTLEDEAGETPICLISWDIDLSNDTVRNAYNINTTRSIVPDTTKLNSTKTPYVPQNLYSTYGESVYNNNKGDLFRCCTPLGVSDNGKYDNFVTYSMCQATGYKLKSNKELPSEVQVFSKIIPKTKHNTDGDKPNGSQLYPMYSVLEFSNDFTELNVTMNRISGIFETLDKDTFTQTQYGSGPLDVKTLCTGTYIAETSRLYGTWLTEDAAKQKDVDERYLHIKF